MEVKVSKDIYKEANDCCNKIIKTLDNMLEILKNNYKKVSKIK